MGNLVIENALRKTLTVHEYTFLSYSKHIIRSSNKMFNELQSACTRICKEITFLYFADQSKQNIFTKDGTYQTTT